MILDKNEVKDLICNRLWFFQFVLKEKLYEIHAGILTLNIDPDDEFSYLTLKFGENGKIKFPTKLGFIPSDYYKWDFDVDTQEVVILSKDEQAEKRLQLPQKEFYYNVDTMVFNKDDKGNSKNVEFLLNFPHYDAFEIRNPTIAGQTMIFIPRDHFKQGVTQHFARRGYPVYPVDHQNDLTEFLQEIMEYLMDQPHLTNIIISRNATSELDINLPKELNHVLLSSSEITTAFDYCAGSRAVIMELLTTVITENNKRQLSPDDNRTVNELLGEVLHNKFINRCEYLQ